MPEASRKLAGGQPSGLSLAQLHALSSSQLRARALRLLQMVKERDPNQFTKSGIMVGLGETKEEVMQVMDDMRSAGVDFITMLDASSTAFRCDCSYSAPIDSLPAQPI